MVMLMSYQLQMLVNWLNHNEDDWKKINMCVGRGMHLVTRWLQQEYI
jgi:hypothetical protein